MGFDCYRNRNNDVVYKFDTEEKILHPIDKMINEEEGLECDICHKKFTNQNGIKIQHNIETGKTKFVPKAEKENYLKSGCWISGRGEKFSNKVSEGKHKSKQLVLNHKVIRVERLDIKEDA